MLRIIEAPRRLEDDDNSDISTMSVEEPQERSAAAPSVPSDEKVNDPPRDASDSTLGLDMEDNTSGRMPDASDSTRMQDASESTRMQDASESTHDVDNRAKPSRRHEDESESTLNADNTLKASEKRMEDNKADNNEKPPERQLVERINRRTMMLSLQAENEQSEASLGSFRSLGRGGNCSSRSLHNSQNLSRGGNGSVRSLHSSQNLSRGGNDSVRSLHSSQKNLRIPRSSRRSLVLSENGDSTRSLSRAGNSRRSLAVSQNGDSSRSLRLSGNSCKNLALSQNGDSSRSLRLSGTSRNSLILTNDDSIRSMHSSQKNLSRGSLASRNGMSMHLKDLSRWSSRNGMSFHNDSQHSSQQKLMHASQRLNSSRNGLSYRRSSYTAIKSSVAELIEEEVDPNLVLGRDDNASRDDESSECSDSDSFYAEDFVHTAQGSSSLNFCQSMDDSNNHSFLRRSTASNSSRSNNNSWRSTASKGSKSSSQMRLEELLAEKSICLQTLKSSEISTASLSLASSKGSKGSKNSKGSKILSDSFRLAFNHSNSLHGSGTSFLHGSGSLHSRGGSSHRSLRNRVRFMRAASWRKSNNSQGDDSLGGSSHNGLGGSSHHNRFIKPESSKLRAFREGGGDQVDADQFLSNMTPLPTKLAELGLFGRSKEVKRLRQCLTQWETPSTPKQASSEATTLSPEQEQSAPTPPKALRNLVWIAGMSGTGKSSLADFAFTKAVVKQKGLYVKGKFDSQSRSSERPFVGFASACEDLCVQLLASKGQHQKRYAQFHTSLQQTMSEKEAMSLLKTVPGLGPILESLVPSSYSRSNNNTSGGAMAPGFVRQGTAESIGGPAEQTMQEAKHRFHFVFRKFIRVVSGVFPLLFLLDDLHWADAGSLQLLEGMILDQNMSGLIIVGCYRDDEVEQGLTRLLREVDEKEEEFGLRVDNITLGALKPRDLNLLMAKLLDLEPAQTRTLTDICHKKTGGNAFFFNRFVTMLWKEKLLKFDVLSHRWQWTEDDIANSSDVTENVVFFLKDRLAELPHHARQLLLFASCLGAEFEAGTMSLIMEDFYPGVSYEGDLERCIEEGVLEKCSASDRYRWVHDKLIEAAQTLLGPEELVRLKYCLGAVLLKCLDEQSLDDNIFLVTNLLNEAPAHIYMPARLAELNLLAARKAASLSSFDAAVNYCCQGIELLPENTKWSSSFELALHLHTTAAEMFAILGDYDAMEAECNEVLSRPDVDILDKIRPHEVLMDSICYRNRVVEAREMCLDILRQLGVHFPRNTVLVMSQITMGLVKAKTQSAKRWKTLRSIPLIQDERQIATTRLMVKLSKYAMMTNSPLLPLATLRGDAFSQKFGLSNDSPVNTASLGMMIGAFVGDIQTGSKYAKLALELVNRLPSQHILAEVVLISYGYVLHRTKPVHELLKPLLAGYDLALQTGNTEHACFNIYFYLLLAFRSGKGLGAIEKDLRAYSIQIENMQIDKPLVFARMLWQMIMNLMGFTGTSTNPLALSGEAMDEKDFLDAHSNDSYYFTQYQAHQTHLYALFGEHKMGAKLALSKDDILSANPGTPYVVMDTFYSAVSLFAMARLTKKRKYTKRAKKLKAKIDGWAKNGDPNVVHFRFFLSAELAALQGKKQKAAKRYEEAIVTSSRHGFIQDAALANERLAELFEELKDESSAAFRFEEAIRLYGEWGAKRKVVSLMEQKAALLENAASQHPNQIILVRRTQPTVVPVC